MSAQRRTPRRTPPVESGDGRADTRGGGTGGAAATGRTLEAIIDDHFGDVPQAVWDDVPDDLIENLDHYVHGADRR